MHLRLFLTLFLFLSIFSLNADTISSEMWEFDFQNPSGWKYQKESGTVLLGHDSIAGLILVFAHELKDMQSLKNEMQKGLNEDGGYLHLQGNLKKSTKNSYVGNYTGMYEMQQVKAKGYGTLSPHGGGAIIIAMSTPESYSKQLADAGNAIAKSMNYKKSDSTNLAKRFIGKWATYSKYSETTIYLYPDGTYADNTTSSYGNSDPSLGATWGAASDSRSRGHWKAKGNARAGQLIFTDPNGESGYYDYHVHEKNGNTYWSEYYIGNKLYSRSALQ